MSSIVANSSTSRWRSLPVTQRVHLQRRCSLPGPELQNGDLLAVAEKDFQAFITTDKNLPCQQNFTGRQLAILVLPTTSWPRVQQHLLEVVAAVNALQPGDCIDLKFGNP